MNTGGTALYVSRFLIGVGESMALPNFNRTVANWSAPSEHGLAISLAIGGIGIGSAVTPPITAWIMVNFGWQVAFYASGGLGLFVAAIWYFYATDQPDQHPVSMRENWRSLKRIALLTDTRTTANPILYGLCSNIPSRPGFAWIAARVGWTSALGVAALVTLAGANRWITIRPGNPSG